MTFLYIVVQVLSLIGLICGLFMFWRMIKPEFRKEKGIYPFLSIIIPARNEALRLPNLLRSLEAQNYQHFEIIVVDDDSTDETSLVAKRYGTQYLKAENIGDMKFGKANACANGARHAKGEWLLFLDADVQFVGFDSLEKILSSFTKQNGKGILSLQPYHKIVKQYENLSVIFNIIVLTGMNVFTFWKEKFKTAGSFGPCILCDRASYEWSGGHEEAKESIMDDFALSAVFFAKNLPVTNYMGKEIMDIRMYEAGYRQLIEGWTKNLATASQATHPVVMTLIQFWILGVLLATIAPVIAVIEGSVVLIILSLTIYFIYGIHVYALARRAGNFSGIVLIFYPAFVVFFIIIFMYSLFRTHILGTVTWKGRKIEL